MGIPSLSIPNHSYKASYLSVIELVVANVAAAVDGLVPVDQYGEGTCRSRL